jgi:hypothetical protein
MPGDFSTFRRTRCLHRHRRRRFEIQEVRAP